MGKRFGSRLAIADHIGSGYAKQANAIKKRWASRLAMVGLHEI